MDDLIEDEEYREIMDNIKNKEQYIKLLNYFKVISVRHLKKRQYEEAMNIFREREKRKL